MSVTETASLPCRRPGALAFALPGVLLGFVLSRSGFTDFDEVNRMFTLEDFRLIGVFGVGVVLTALAFRVIAPTIFKSMHDGIVPGSIIFGIGWALCGACPGVMFAQLGEGKLYAFITLLGAFAGNRAVAIMERRRTLPPAE